MYPWEHLSLKAFTSFLGFSKWDTDPCDAGSIRWFHPWVETGDDSIRRRILECNEDDCRATQVLVDALTEIRSPLRVTDTKGCDEFRFRVHD